MNLEVMSQGYVPSYEDEELEKMEDNMASPTLAPVFINKPSKYMVQYSWSMIAGGIWISVHSVTKSASTWDLMAAEGCT
jgi:hypothetical protein